MDLYLFYNCVNNITEIIETPESKISLRHELMLNDPLINNFYLNNLSIIPKSINSSVGGAAAVKTGKLLNAVGKLTNSADGKLPNPADKKLLNQADKKNYKNREEGDNKGKSKAEALEDKALEEEIEKASIAAENAGELDGLKKFLKKLSKLIIGLLFVLIIPIIPWVMITFYSFKKLANFFEINTNRL